MLESCYMVSDSISFREISLWRNIFEFRNNAGAITAFQIRIAWVNIRQKKKRFFVKVYVSRQAGKSRNVLRSSRNRIQPRRILKAVRRVDVSTCRKCRHVYARKTDVWNPVKFEAVFCKFAQYTICKLNVGLISKIN